MVVGDAIDDVDDMPGVEIPTEPAFSFSDPDIGIIPGDLSDELKGDYFVSGYFISKKLYIIRLKQGKHKIAAKGIPMQADTDQRINMETMPTLLNGARIEGCNTTTFKRDTGNWTMQTVPLVRNIQCTFTSRVIGQGFRTYPMGYKDIPFPLNESPELECVRILKARINHEELINEYFDDIGDDVALGGIEFWSS